MRRRFTRYKFFATFRQINNLVQRRDRFFNFDLGHVTEAGKVENCRFLENWSMKFAENRQKKSVLNILSPPIKKNRDRKFADYFRLYIDKIFKKKNRFFFKSRLSICLHVAKNRLLISCKTAAQYVP